MKRAFILFLIFALVVPSVVLAADVPVWLIEGSWNHFESTDDGMLLTSLYLTEDGIVYFMTQLFRSDGPGLGRAFVGSWEKTGDDTLHVIIGNNASIDLTYCSYNMMYDYASMSYYFRAELEDNDKIK